MEDLVGKTLGKYRLVEYLGRGGMAAVYKAYQPNLERHVAIKVMHASLLADNTNALPLFEREAKNVAALRHPNIVQVHDFDVEGDTPYMVMELIEGGSLKAHLEKLRETGKWVSIGESTRIIREVGQALSYAHQRHMIHRDVKPANVMIETTGRMILTDFGIAKLLTGSSHTATGTAMGTPAYMAPEQGRGLPVDHRSDVYSLGVMLYELLARQLPYSAETPLAIIFKHITEPLPPPRGINPDLSEGLERVILKSLDKTPDERYQSVDEMLFDLQTALGEAETRPGPALPSYELPTQKAEPPSEMATADAAAPLAPPWPPAAGAIREAPAPEITRPPQPLLPPRIGEFAGREAELASLTEKLAASHLVIITGMPGIGKTTLAAVLTERVGHPAKTFWHSFHEGEGVNALVWKLAGFLFWHDQPTLWNILQKAQETGGQPPPSEMLFDYLFQMIREQGYLICFDDFQFVEDDPLLGQFITGLREVIEAGEVSVIVASRHMPEFAPSDEFNALAGLSMAAVHQLLEGRSAVLSDELIATLYALTEGNAQLLTLALDSLRRGKDPARLIQRLSESEHVERFLMKEVSVSLTEEERKVMSAVAVLMGYPGARSAISVVLDGRNTRLVLNDLASRYLLTVTDGEIGKEYIQHAIVREFYYDLLDKRDRQAMHLRAGEYYETEEPDVLKAARHYQRAGQQERAAQLITADVWSILNKGQARALRLLLEGIAERGIAPAQWAAVNLARGQAYALLGETPLARESYESAHAQLTALPDSTAVRELKARACRGVAELLQDDAPNEALGWLNRGLEELSGTNTLEEAALRIRTGRILVYQGKHVEALAELNKGLSLLPDKPSRLLITALGNLGNIYSIQGDAAQAHDYYRRVLEISQELNDYWAMVEVWLNLGIELRIAGRWAESLAELQQALKQAEQLGSLDQQVRAWLELGMVYLQQGEDEAAQFNLSECLTLARARGWTSYQIYAQPSLAYILLCRGELAEAERLLAEAERLALESGSGQAEALPEIYRYRALVRLAQSEPAAALEYAERALNLSRELKAENEEGMSLRVLGQAQTANGQLDAALASFEESLKLLADHDPYEAARTKMEWGRRLKSAGETQRSLALLREAGEAFRQLGARRDSVAMDEILRK